MTEGRLILGSGWLLLGLTACHSRPSDPAPPPPSFEIASAPPGARGARAAGTDAAPPPPTERELADPGTEAPLENEDTDAGLSADGGLVPDAGPGIAL